MRILPSQSNVMKQNVGSTLGLVTVRFEAILCRDSRPVMDTRAAQRVHTQLQSRSMDRAHVDYIFKVRNISAKVIVPMSCGGRQSLLQDNARFTSAS